MILNPRLRRLMIPRWRSLRLTIRAKELASPYPQPNEGQLQGGISPELQSRLEKWRLNPNLLRAAELVETSIVDGQEEEGIAAARFLIGEGSMATPLVKKQAAALLKRAGLGSEIPDYISLGPNPTKSLWRRRTRLYPQSAVAWVELALDCTIDGHLDQAQRAMLVALQLEPNNRHVLRSASRFFIHRNDPLRAYDIIAKSDAVTHDPWLISAELALAEHIDREPRYYKRGFVMLEEQRLPRQITELAGSIATKELIEGNKRKARRLFKASMLDPNANALAQAEWATPNFGNNLFPVSKLQTVEEAHEARALYRFREGQYPDVYAECELWRESEPYSIRPYELAASTANVLEEHEKAEEVTRRGLKLRPNTPNLLNSRAYALVGLNKLNEAEVTLAKLPSDTPEWMHYVAEANRGLIAFRRGKTLEGTSRYQNAIDGFQQIGQGQMALSAKTYFCRELVRLGLPDGEKMLEELRSSVNSTHVRSIKQVFKNAEDFPLARKLMRERENQLPALTTNRH